MKFMSSKIEFDFQEFCFRAAIAALAAVSLARWYMMITFTDILDMSARLRTPFHVLPMSDSFQNYYYALCIRIQRSSSSY